MYVLFIVWMRLINIQYTLPKSFCGKQTTKAYKSNVKIIHSQKQKQLGNNYAGTVISKIVYKNLQWSTETFWGSIATKEKIEDAWKSNRDPRNWIINHATSILSLLQIYRNIKRF